MKQDMVQTAYNAVTWGADTPAGHRAGTINALSLTRIRNRIAEDAGAKKLDNLSYTVTETLVETPLDDIVAISDGGSDTGDRVKVAYNAVTWEGDTSEGRKRGELNLRSLANVRARIVEAAGGGKVANLVFTVTETEADVALDDIVALVELTDTEDIQDEDIQDEDTEVDAQDWES